MANFSTKYLGLELKNPIVVGSSSLVKSMDGIRRCADAGAGAVVMKSLFEEQITAEMKQEDGGSSFYGAEAQLYFEQMSMSHGPRYFIETIEKAKKSVDIPLIASLNCVSSNWWIDYAKQIERAGADALELNIANMPIDPKIDAAMLENQLIETIKTVKAEVNLPLAVKIGPYYTAMASLVDRLSRAGLDGLVLFNRFYQFDINIDTLKLTPGYRLSSAAESHLPLRWISILSGTVDCDLAAATGIEDGREAIKQILAGATVVQVCSTLYRNGVDQIGQILSDMEDWMTEHNFESLNDFRGKLRRDASSHPESYERIQYVKALVGDE
jgi:dihydroorotate dehydrogenase (fumarate)